MFGKRSLSGSNSSFSGGSTSVVVTLIRPLVQVIDGPVGKAMLFEDD